MIRIIFLVQLVLQLNCYAVEFVLFTQPKTGTHLLIPILVQLTGKNAYWAPEFKNADLCDHTQNIDSYDKFYFSLSKDPWNTSTMKAVWSLNKSKGCFLHLHPPFTTNMEQFLKDHNSISFFVKRDPRDQLVSLLNHYKKFGFPDEDLDLLSNDDERLLMMIRKDLRYNTQKYMGWITSPVCCVLDFSKLMGQHGGDADDLDALNEIKKIANTLEIDLSYEQAQQIYRKSFGKSWTFFRGKVGSWKEYYKQEHVVATKEEIGDLLIELGYENDLKW